ncbi:MAG: flagellar motor protein MotA [Rhodospirillales bacterium]|jgi:hypothetical protein|nr:flagellar motor protein MotA [Rhodospirillales bacterium]MBT4040606.1 flagellar motor protein MotA [Rhodospirillales bacterium]MBT4628106.1 flagellar motor protein MotA [Rhodospirillales bacterium]MBT5352629.1 flagellar motor protein MotA [Rhodospirillales bacterium]MBT5520654.1 flagellar motor protein MotA [Rhodospirillales bacterium]
MTRPQHFLIRMMLFVGAVIAVVIFLYMPLQEAFRANVPLNSLIVSVLLLGIIYNFRQVLMLNPDVKWLEDFQQNKLGGQPPHLLAPMATMLGDQSDFLRLSALSMRSVLDGIASRLDESRELSRYTIGLLVFLGLLGTFWGLLDTVSSIRGVISSLSVTGGDIGEVFQDLKNGLEKPLGGMGTAFSSSLLGLAGSLILGFLDLQAGQAQNRFYNELEEWLSSVTRLSSGSGLSAEGDQAVPAYVQALLEQTADSLENLQRTLTRGEESRIAVNLNLQQMGEQMSILTDHMRTEQTLMKSMAESQMGLQAVLTKMSDTGGANAASALDDASRGHIRSLDLLMGRLVEEMSTGRADMLQQIRSEIKLLARTVAALSENKNS